LAYDYQPQADAPERDIILLATDGSREIPLIQHAADDFVLGWAPDGKQLLFASDRPGSLGVWLVQIADGTAQGAPELVKREMGTMVPLGLTPSGAVYYGTQARKPGSWMSTRPPWT